MPMHAIVQDAGVYLGLKRQHISKMPKELFDDIDARISLRQLQTSNRDWEKIASTVLMEINPDKESELWGQYCSWLDEKESQRRVKDFDRQVQKICRRR